jgi:hypothetical protein
MAVMWDVLWISKEFLTFQYVGKILQVICLLLIVKVIMVAVTTKSNLLLKNFVFKIVDSVHHHVSESVLDALEKGWSLSLSICYFQKLGGICSQE